MDAQHRNKLVGLAAPKVKQAGVKSANFPTKFLLHNARKLIEPSPRRIWQTENAFLDQAKLPRFEAWQPTARLAHVERFVHFAPASLKESARDVSLKEVAKPPKVRTNSQKAKHRSPRDTWRVGSQEPLQVVWTPLPLYTKARFCLHRQVSLYPP